MKQMIIALMVLVLVGTAALAYRSFEFKRELEACSKEDYSNYYVCRGALYNDIECGRPWERIREFGEAYHWNEKSILPICKKLDPENNMFCQCHVIIAELKCTRQDARGFCKAWTL